MLNFSKYMPQVDRFRPYAAVYLALIKDRKVLLLKRVLNSYQAGNYSLVAGHLDGGETVKETMIRETKEEAGIILKLEDLEVVHAMHRVSIDREYVDFYIRCGKWDGEVTNMEPNKCDELKWFDLKALPDNMAPEVKLALKSIDKNIHYSEYGWDILNK